MTYLCLNCYGYQNNDNNNNYKTVLESDQNTKIKMIRKLDD